MTEDNTEKMPEVIFAEKRISIGERCGGRWFSDSEEAGDPYYSQSELDRRVAEAEERQRESIYEQMYLKIGNWGGPQREAFDEALIILGAILNAGGQGDE